MEVDKELEELEPEQNFTPRQYQDELCDVGIKKNSIIYLPTGSGKTFIAILIMKHFSKDFRLPISEGGKRSVFLVNTVVLTQQQTDYIKNVTAFKIGRYSGDMNVDAWRRDRWADEFNDNQVIIATCQIVLDVIRHGFISLKNINLIVFDECHHGRNSHPMHQLMALFGNVPVHEQPRVIGLTGMLIDGHVTTQSVIGDIEKLENTFRSTIVTVQNIRDFNNVLVYSTKPHELIYKYQSNPPSSVMGRISALIEKCVENIMTYQVDDTHTKKSRFLTEGMPRKNPIKKLRKLFTEFQYQMTDTGIYGASIAILSVLVDLEMKKRESDTIRMRTLIRYLITEAECIRHILVKEMADDDDVDDMDDDNAADGEDYDNQTKILTHSSNKVNLLLSLLKQFFMEKENNMAKGIVFVQRRYSAKCLYHIINKYCKTLKNCKIVPEFMVGSNTSLAMGIDDILENKWNRRVVERFKKNEINLIVASSVLEEGVDLQSCNLVMTYDVLKTFRSYVQTKGRARHKDSKYIIMAPYDDYNKTVCAINEYRKIDQLIRDFLLKKTIDRPPPSEADIKNEHVPEIPPFKTKKGAILDACSAISLLNRYCNTLPNDQFTVSTTIWEENMSEKERTITVTVTLPMQSQVKDKIVGEPMTTLRMAKRTAAFNACIELYRCGELNENLFPINSRKCIEIVTDLYFKKYQQYPNDNSRLAGTPKMIRIHDLEHTVYTTSVFPQTNHKNMLYIIKMQPSFPAATSDDYSTKIFQQLYASPKTFGILTSKQLPKIAAMELFVTLGKINCNIEYDPITIELTNQLSIDKLRNFHCMLFKDVLNVCKEFTIYDYSNEENSYVIVPVNGKEIDWKIVEQFQTLDELKTTTQLVRSNKIHRTEDYLYNVVCPWYRSDSRTRYLVIKVHEHLTPFSPFPNADYNSYADYIEEKYGPSVANKNQFLIEVKGITLHFNRLAPGEGEEGSKNVKMHGPELLIPELCHNYMFPGDLWLKATLLPSILHRFQYLLNAEFLRQVINGYLNIGDDDDGGADQKYIPKAVTQTLKRTIDRSDEKRIPPKSIIIPNPATTEPIRIDKSDIIPFSNNAYLNEWPEASEPADMNRRINQIYPIDIDYYYDFVNNFSKLELFNESANQEAGGGKNGNLLESSSSTLKNLAICDVAKSERSHIKLLDITLKTPVIGPEQCDLLSAITSIRSHDIIDMERFELMGDAYLKFAISLYLLVHHGSWHEGLLTACKGQIVSNRNLCYAAMNMRFAGLLKVTPLNPESDWQVPLFTVPTPIQAIIRELELSPQILYRIELTREEMITGCIDQTKVNTCFMLHGADYRARSLIESGTQHFIGRQCINDKVVADCVEAILGVCVQSVGLERSFALLQMFDILPENDDVDIQKMLQTKFKGPRVRTNISDGDIDQFLINHRKLEERIGYVFRDRAYLLQALTHPSYPSNRITGCYQQSEFIGDAILDLLMTSYIYERCPHMDPGQLTDLRSALVNNITLACICVRNDIHLHMLSQNAVLTESISKFVEFQTKHNHLVSDQVQLLIEEKDINIAEFIDVPKTLGDIFEALIGAIFLDSHNNFQTTWNVLYNLMENEINEFMRKCPIPVIRQLYEYPGASPKFEDPIVTDDKTLVRVRFTRHHEIIEVSGFGNTKDDAQRAAAKLALHKLRLK